MNALSYLLITKLFMDVMKNIVIFILLIKKVLTVVQFIYKYLSIFINI